MEESPRWTFRGYHLDPGHFTTALVHFYRAEVSRANTWRTRLDATTNWAVVTTAAGLTFAFSTPQNPHPVLLLVLILVLTFLYIEARRYRYYELWYYRVHLIETDFLARMLNPPFSPSSDWADSLVESLVHPAFPINRWEAIGRRFRRNYVWLVSLLILSWLAKLTLHPTPLLRFPLLVERAAIGPLSGAVVIGAVVTVYTILVALGVAASIAMGRPQRSLRRRRGPLLPGYPPRERLATVITGQGEAVAAQLLKELGRGVTAVEGKGMYTGEARDVLLCAVTDVQVPHLQEIVRQHDPGAFVIVSPTHEVRGRGFLPFEAP